MDAEYTLIRSPPWAFNRISPAVFEPLGTFTCTEYVIELQRSCQLAKVTSPQHTPGMLPIRGALKRLPSEHRSFSLRRPSLPLHYQHAYSRRHIERFSSSHIPNINNSPKLSSDSHLSPPAKLTMDAKTKQHYLADSPPTVVRLEAKHHFDGLKDEKLRKYAHYMSRFDYFLCWR